MHVDRIWRRFGVNGRGQYLRVSVCTLGYQFSSKTTPIFALAFKHDKIHLL